MLIFATMTNGAVTNISIWPTGSTPATNQVDITNKSTVGVGWTTTDNINFVAPVARALSQMQTVTKSIQKAIDFGNNLELQFVAQNVLAGITQAGQTIPVATYTQALSYYLSTGSLYAAITTINTMITDSGSTKTALSPFITNSILYNYLNQIQTYLKIPLTANPGA